MKREGQMLYLRTKEEIEKAMEEYKDWKWVRCYEIFNRTRNEKVYAVQLQKSNKEA